MTQPPTLRPHLLLLLLLIVAASPARGDHAVQFTTSAEDDWFPTWSPDGSQMAFCRGTIFNLFLHVKPVAGGDAVLVDTGGNPKEPAWSPDGSRIAYSYLSQIWTLPAGGGSPVQLTFVNQTVDDASRPSWSPDGTTIAFSGTIGGAAAPLILTVPAAGGMVGQVTGGPWPHLVPAWSPDGSTIAFSLGATGSADLYTVPSSGGAETPLVTGFGDDTHPAYSPDGSLIAFASNRGGSGYDIWMVPAIGGTPVQITDHVAADRYPAWSPDGTRIAFESARSGSRDIWIIDVLGGPVDDASWGDIKARFLQADSEGD